MKEPEPAVDILLARLERQSFTFFDRHTHPETGLVLDRSGGDVGTGDSVPSSVAGTGFGLACAAVAAERGWLARSVAADRVLRALRTLDAAEQSAHPKRAAGHRGFFYHFLDPATARRAWRSELSTIDSAILFAGALLAAEYFDGDDAAERALRATAHALYRRADWAWAASPRPPAVCHGWTPERGFLRWDWRGYNEALLVYALALGSPTRPAPEGAYDAWCATYAWKRLHGHDVLYAGPLFTHQLAHLFVDLRGVQDAATRERRTTYFENSRRATLVHREYAVRNPRRHAGYDAEHWGLSACDGPGPSSGSHGRTWGYRARGAPFGPDDGTLAPWAVAASLPFAPDVVLPALAALAAEPALAHREGLPGAYNAGAGAGGRPWVAPAHVAVDQGPVVLALENYRSGLPWALGRRCPYVRAGLERAGFTGGWLDA